MRRVNASMMMGENHQLCASSSHKLVETGWRISTPSRHIRTIDHTIKKAKFDREWAHVHLAMSPTCYHNNIRSTKKRKKGIADVGVEERWGIERRVRRHHHHHHRILHRQIQQQQQQQQQWQHSQQICLEVHIGLPINIEIDMAQIFRIFHIQFIFKKIVYSNTKLFFTNCH